MLGRMSAGDDEPPAVDVSPVPGGVQPDDDLPGAHQNVLRPSALRVPSENGPGRHWTVGQDALEATLSQDAPRHLARRLLQSVLPSTCAVWTSYDVPYRPVNTISSVGLVGTLCKPDLVLNAGIQYARRNKSTGNWTSCGRRAARRRSTCCIVAKCSSTLASTSSRAASCQRASPMSCTASTSTTAPKPRWAPTR